VGSIVNDYIYLDIKEPMTDRLMNKGR